MATHFLSHPIVRDLDKSPTTVSEDSKRNVVRWYVTVRAYLANNFSALPPIQ